ncbi:MAG: UDP binding domain-containing protein, partial [Phycisphaeraceae bacterium]|nr:UDP binding domain-containing protein [Phycisphaeraceae bacterium]
VLVIGLAYKPDVSDVRESPSFELIERLQRLGAKVNYHDPHVPRTHEMRHYDVNLASVELTDDRLADADCVLIATHHAACDWKRIGQLASLVVDTRGVMRGIDAKARVVGA